MNQIKYMNYGFQTLILTKRQKRNCAGLQMMKRKLRNGFTVTWNLEQEGSGELPAQVQTV